MGGSASSSCDVLLDHGGLPYQIYSYLLATSVIPISLKHIHPQACSASRPVRENPSDSSPKVTLSPVARQCPGVHVSWVVFFELGREYEPWAVCPGLGGLQRSKAFRRLGKGIWFLGNCQQTCVCTHAQTDGRADGQTHAKIPSLKEGLKSPGPAATCPQSSRSSSKNGCQNPKLRCSNPPGSARSCQDQGR